MTSLSLDLKKNNLKDDMIDSMISRIETCRTIKDLRIDLGQNNLVSKSYGMIASMISDLPNLVKIELGLEENNIKVQEMKILCGIEF